MNLLLDHSFFNSSTKEKHFVSSSLKKFYNSSLSQILEKDLKSAQTIWKSINQFSSKIFIFAFGGAGSISKIASSLLSVKNKKVFLIDTINEESLTYLAGLKKTELKSCQLLFISKSGQTRELIFYKSFLKKIYSKKNLSLKGRLTLLTQSSNSPLLQWINKEGGSIIFSHTSLPGRFSFFTLSGFLQLQAHSRRHWRPLTAKNSDSDIKSLEFLIHHCLKRKEIFFCPFNPQLKELSHWLELCWSESLFKQPAKKQVPVLRNIPLSDLRHACIEELIVKKDQNLFWALDIKSKNKPNLLYENQLKSIFKAKKIPYLFIKMPLNNEIALVELIFFFYKIFFLMGDFFKSNIYTQPWVDYLKKV